ncbi:MAG: DUF5009 domain-containing protein [Bacteroidales bacterium]|nr:DUF5009 domain-containing protein [Bacteroidales bacterium]
MEQPTKRLQSIDALRGFDMFWIMGGPWIIASLHGIFGGHALEWLNVQMEHVPWDGFHFMDLIFPLFLFIAGVSFPFSLDKRRENNQSDRVIYKHSFKRVVTLIILGLIYNGLLKLDLHTARYASVLAHIGIAWFIASIIFMNVKKNITIIWWITGILISYGLLNLFVLSPNALGNNPFLPENNIVTQFDRWFLPGVLYNGNFDPEGILSVIPAIATALIGMLAGRFLNSIKVKKQSIKAIILFAAGSGFVLLSFAVNLLIPFNKALWSSSFVLLTGGISLVLLSLFFYIIDVKGFVKWTFFFRVIGMNSIVIYMAQPIVNFYGIADFFLGGLAAKFSPEYSSLLLSIGYVAACWLFLWFLYRQKIFIKV